MNIIEFTLAFSYRLKTYEIPHEAIQKHFDQYIKTSVLSFENYMQNAQLKIDSFTFASKPKFYDLTGISVDCEVLYYRTGLAAEEVIYIEIDMARAFYNFYDGEIDHESQSIDEIVKIANKYYLTTLI